MSYLIDNPVKWILKSNISCKETEYARWVMEKQSMEKENWKHFIHVFSNHEDSLEGREDWKGEFFGKMMRGSSLLYQLFQNEELYQVLTEACLMMLSTQDEDGRFSTYEKEHEFTGWDLWSRKYVMTGFEHYYDICKDSELKNRILEALKRHADYIISHIGPNKNQKSILDTSKWYGGVNSASILEPMVRLYEMSKEKRYLDFSEYILSTGGCKDGNLIELAKEDKLFPYQYPEVKAYETTSFFEGVLAYYQATGKEEYLSIVKRYMEKVYASDITIIGCSGMTHELFDHSSIKQTELIKAEIEPQRIAQETCVTVTLMRMLTRLYLLTGDKRYLDRLEISNENALYGSRNEHHLKQHELWSDKMVEGLPIDSYSPLFCERRGRGVGGYREFKEGGYYGCCASIAPAGFALYPLLAVVKEKDEIVINYPLNGSYLDSSFSLEIESSYPEKPEFQIKVHALGEKVLKLRKMDSLYFSLTCNGKEEKEEKNGYYVLHVKEGDILLGKGEYEVKEEKLNHKTAFTYGPFVLALDPEKDPLKHSLSDPISLIAPFKMVPVEKGERLRFLTRDQDGKEVVFINYSSAGKHWDKEPNRISVWLDVK